MTEPTSTVEKDAPAIDLGVSNFFGGDVFEHYQEDGYFIVATTDETALELEPGDFVVKRKWSTSVVPYVHRVIPPAEPCRECGPGYRIGDEGCRHIPPAGCDEFPHGADDCGHPENHWPTPPGSGGDTDG